MKKRNGLALLMMILTLLLSGCAAQTIARETGASIYTLDPCVSGDESKESYENIMRENAKVLTEAFAQ